VNKWGKFWRLSRPERRLLLKAFIILPLISLGLRLLGLQRLQTVLSRLGSGKKEATNEETALAKCQITARLVSIASRHGFYRATCLPRSLALWWLLKSQGIECDMRFGVRKNEGGLDAHAWVEYLGRPLDDSQEVHENFSAFEKKIISSEMNKQ
jgi:hypothetical protein